MSVVWTTPCSTLFREGCTRGVDLSSQRSIAVERAWVGRGAGDGRVVHILMIDSLVGFQEFPNHRACEQLPPQSGVKKEIGLLIRRPRTTGLGNFKLEISEQLSGVKIRPDEYFVSALRALARGCDGSAQPFVHGSPHPMPGGSGACAGTTHGGILRTAGHGGVDHCRGDDGDGGKLGLLCGTGDLFFGSGCGVENGDRCGAWGWWTNFFTDLARRTGLSSALQPWRATGGTECHRDHQRGGAHAGGKETLCHAAGTAR